MGGEPRLLTRLSVLLSLEGFGVQAEKPPSLTYPGRSLGERRPVKAGSLEGSPGSLHRWKVAGATFKQPQEAALMAAPQGPLHSERLAALLAGSPKGNGHGTTVANQVPEHLAAEMFIAPHHPPGLAGLFLPRNSTPTELSVTNVNLPTHVTLTANVVSSVDINGAWGRLHYITEPSATIVFARNDGTDPTTTPVDRDWPVFPSPADWECIPSTPTSLTTTTVKLKSTGTPTVHIKECDCDD
jgi:hypothetical protein